MGQDRQEDTSDTPRTGGGLSRRQFIGVGAAAGAAAALAGGSPAVAAGVSAAARRGGGSAGWGDADLILLNGRIHTMDGSDTVARSVTIRNGRFAGIDAGARARGPQARVINLHGRTVVPGIIDNHNHIVVMGNRPGHHTPLENAGSIAEVQETVATRSVGLEPGEWITTIGGFHFNQFTEGRLPTLTELDDAAPDHPVYISVGFAGPTVTNSAGKAWLEDRGVPVGADGTIDGGGFGPSPTGQALLALRQELLTPETRRRGAIEAMAYGAGLGITTHLDQGAFQATGTPADGAAHEDNYTMHLPFLDLYRDGELGSRLRINFLNLETDPAVPQLMARLRNAFQLFGGDLVRTGGIGEFTAGDAFELFSGSEPSEAWKNGTRRVAEAGWRNENHSLSATDYQAIIQGWEAVGAEIDITGLRWVLAHVPFITPEYVSRLEALGGGLSLTGWRYLSGTSSSNGPPFRMIADHGIHTGMSSDGMQIAPMNPWLHMYYATTGVNARGDLINDGQQIDRGEVLRMYTADNGWFMHEEDELGTIEEGTLADLVVLNKDYFAVTDQDLKTIRSDLTVVGGAVVHDTGVVA